MGYSSKSGFSRIKPPDKIESFDHVKQAIAVITDAINKTHGKLNNEFQSLERNINQVGSVTVVNTSGSSGGGGGTSGIVVRSNQVGVLATGSTVSFSSSMGVAPKVLVVSCYVVENNHRRPVGCDVHDSEVTATDFKIYPDENATCEYFAIGIN